MRLVEADLGAVREVRRLSPDADAEVTELYERVHGRFETVTLFVDKFVTQNQVRGDRNSGESGLINQFDTVNLDGPEMQNYINFTNQVWGANADIKDIRESRMPDGSYYLVVAGHTRLRALQELEAEGRIPRWPVEAKVHPVSTIAEILSIQLDENIHTQPPRERRAKAVVEYYLWGIKQEQWSNQKEFLEQHPDISKTVLSEALAFSHLPAEIRNFVFAKKVPHHAGLALGRAIPDLREYVSARIGSMEGLVDSSLEDKIDEQVRTRLIIESNVIASKKLNSTAAEARIKAWREQMRREMITDASMREQADKAALFDLDLKTSEQIHAEDMKQLKKQFAEVVRSYGKTPGSWAVEMIGLNRGYVDERVIQEALEDFQVSFNRGIKLMGDSALLGAAADSSR